MKSKFLNFEVDDKILKLICFSTILIILLLCLSLFLENGALRSYKPQADTKIDNGEEVVCDIEDINIKGKFIEISGTAYKKGQNIGFFDNRFVIQNMETKEYRALHTEMTYVDELYSVDGKYDCRRAGMYSNSISFGLKHGKYKVFIEYKNDNENILVDTGKTFKY